MQAVVEMGDEAEQAEDSERHQQPVAGGEAEQQDEQGRGEARRAEREQADDQGRARGGETCTRLSSS